MDVLDNPKGCVFTGFFQHVINDMKVITFFRHSFDRIFTIDQGKILKIFTCSMFRIPLHFGKISFSNRPNYIHA